MYVIELTVLCGCARVSAVRRSLSSGCTRLLATEVMEGVGICKCMGGECLQLSWRCVVGAACAQLNERRVCVPACDRVGGAR